MGIGKGTLTIAQKVFLKLATDPGEMSFFFALSFSISVSVDSSFPPSLPPKIPPSICLSTVDDSSLPPSFPPSLLPTALRHVHGLLPLASDNDDQLFWVPSLCVGKHGHHLLLTPLSLPPSLAPSLLPTALWHVHGLLPLASDNDDESFRVPSVCVGKHRDHLIFVFVCLATAGKVTTPHPLVASAKGAGGRKRVRG